MNRFCQPARGPSSSSLPAPPTTTSPTQSSQLPPWGRKCPRTTLWRCPSATGRFPMFLRQQKAPSQTQKLTTRPHRTPTRHHNPRRNDDELPVPVTNVAVRRSSATANSHVLTARSTVMVRYSLCSSRFEPLASTSGQTNWFSVRQNAHMTSLPTDVEIPHRNTLKRWKVDCSAPKPSCGSSCPTST